MYKQAMSLAIVVLKYKIKNAYLLNLFIITKAVL